ncbi:hypothetical protein FSY45_24195 [Comamonas sp. Z1]|uniref:hypothetical protein n=1 Tax=Comamonas TaxID=283 RepID=UPI000AE85737|nr:MULTISPECIES: hypothetical protein [Comamonas]TYK71030.1 hypothetical protein FSY45_24195 [Comamonas sp. Z1]TYK73371.1 hypothetical protein FSY59_01710 [Comamonas sp. Z3]
MQDSRFEEDLRLMAYAMYDSPGSLQVKLQAIWKQSANCIHQIEEKRPTDLQKAYRKIGINPKELKNFKEPFINGQISEEYSKNIKDIVFYPYAGLIITALRIKKNYYNTISSKENYPDPFSEEFRLQLFLKENFINSNFINQVVPEFFPLQLHSYSLLRILQIKKGVPVSEEIRSKRALTAVASRHYGEEVLMNETLKAISKIQDVNKNNTSIDDFFKKHRKIFDQVLRDYQDILGSPVVKGGPTLEFGEKLVTDDLPKYLKKWCNDKQFRSALNNNLETEITN